MIRVIFTKAGSIGSRSGTKKIMALNEIRNEQKGWLDINYLSNSLTIFRGDKGHLFILRKINKLNLFKNFEKFFKNFKIYIMSLSK